MDTTAVLIFSTAGLSVDKFTGSQLHTHTHTNRTVYGGNPVDTCILRSNDAMELFTP